jgi:tRNA(Ile)-lysidine synthase
VNTKVAVATSGGRDSTALLHCTVRAAAGLGVEVTALHVQHGLVPEAEQWLQQVRGQARRWGAGFAAARLQTQPAAGESVEAWARRERYRALADMALAAGCSLVLLAHHRRDQAETWLLQALRGAGAQGLSAMPGVAQRAGLFWARPWLDLPREAIETYLRRHRLRFVDDASNGDPRYARNRLRLRVWPALTAAFPDAETVLCAAARHAQDAAALAAEVAAVDVPAACTGRGLDVKHWLDLPPARRRNALGAWLLASLGAAPPDTLVQRLMAELPGSRAARWPAPGAELRLYRGVLAPYQAAPAVALLAPPAAFNLPLPGELALPVCSGFFRVELTEQGGAPALQLAQVQARARTGGERFSLAPLAMPRSLKKQFQARGVPALERQGPLLFTADGHLLFVPGLGIDGRLQASPGQSQWRITWHAITKSQPLGPG